MIIAKRSGTTGTLVALAAVATLGSAATAFAQTAFTVNDVDVDSSVLNMYVESRLQRPANQATPEELAVITQELTDIYLLTTSPSANALAEDAGIKAQIELQGRAVLAQAVAAETGALVYWLDADESAAVIAEDKETLGTIGAALGN